ncbi:MAG TPA: hypothetical protein VL181_06595, partial [Holophagaceae bacterium]|nr:hypothetical protein [Holophagaceae bacterium]
MLMGDLSWMEELLGEAPARLVSFERALAFKADIVHRDPLEQGERRLLNLGHTLGHAVESASGYALLHGEAVGMGLLACCLLGESLGQRPFPPAFMDRLAARLAPLSAHLPPWEALIPWLARDKKGIGLRAGAGEPTIHCILPRPGETALQRQLPLEAWREPYARLQHLLQGDPSRA